MQSNKNLNILLGVLAVIVLAFIFFYTRGAVNVSVDSSIKTEKKDSATEMASFLRKISAIKDVRLDVSVFDNPVLKYGLKDESKELTPEDKGRPDPFAPLSGYNGQSATINQAINNNSNQKSRTLSD